MYMLALAVSCTTDLGASPSDALRPKKVHSGIESKQNTANNYQVGIKLLETLIIDKTQFLKTGIMSGDPFNNDKSLNFSHDPPRCPVSQSVLFF